MMLHARDSTVGTQTHHPVISGETAQSRTLSELRVFASSFEIPPPPHRLRDMHGKPHRMTCLSYFINPHLVTKAISETRSCRSSAHKKGTIRLADVRKILPRKNTFRSDWVKHVCNQNESTYAATTPFPSAFHSPSCAPHCTITTFSPPQNPS